MPFPKEETTPPVTNRYLGLDAFFITQDGISG